MSRWKRFALLRGMMGCDSQVPQSGNYCCVSRNHSSSRPTSTAKGCNPIFSRYDNLEWTDQTRVRDPPQYLPSQRTLSRPEKRNSKPKGLCLFKKENENVTTHSTLSGHLLPQLTTKGLKWPLWYFYWYDMLFFNCNVCVPSHTYFGAIATIYFYIMYLCINDKLKTNIIPVLLVKVFSYIVYIVCFFFFF